MSKRNLSDYQYFKIDVTDGIACIAFNRVKKHNVVTLETFKELNEFLMRVGEDEGIDVVILTGNGEKAFCAGVDIESFEIQNAGQALEWAIQCQSVFSSIERLPKPVIAAVSGFALGGGCELAMLCDFIIAADNARFGQPEIKLGVIPGAGGTQRLPRAVGKAKAMDMALTGRMMDAAEAERSGLVSRVVPLDKLMDEALAAALIICSFSQLATRAAKEAVNRAVESGLADGVQFERRLFHALFATEDQKEGMDAFMNKRKAVFTHR
jgi:enoyl-CoA hydratase